jgi:hypothetical protein
MRTSELISIALFTIALVLTVYAWRDRIAGSNAAINEAFENNGPVLSKEELAQLRSINEEKPSAQDAEKAYRTLLRYIRNDFPVGIKFVDDFGKRFFGDDMPLRKDLDTRRLMDNYMSPLQGV